MRLPSIAHAVTDARRTALRFPLVILVAAVGTIAAIVLVDTEGLSGPTNLFRAIFASILGIPLLSGIVLTAEKKKWSSALKIGLQLLGIILLAAYAMTVPRDLTDVPFIHVIRLLILAVALHLFVAAAPWIGRSETNGFWHYNETLFLRLVISAVYTFVLWAGLSIALAALDNLFGVKITPRRYAELWVLLVGLFNTWFFLAGAPDDLEKLDEVSDYPRELKIFAQYILFPLVLVYLAILYAYLGKILVSWNWPQGWVSKLILGFAGTGIFSLLLMHPVSGRTENVWVKNASRWFYVILIPLVVMLFFAVSRRVSEYGITEGRYLAIAVGTWLSIVILYFVVSRTKSIKFIPASLCVTAFIVSFGPWGIFSVSEQSQIGRLKELLTKNAILVDGKVRKTESTVPFEDRKQISSVIAYLGMFHGLDGIQPWFGENLKHETSEWRFKDPAAVVKLMGLEYTRAWQFGSGSWMVFTPDSKQGVELNGYDCMIRIRQYYLNNSEKSVPGQDLGYCVTKDMSAIVFQLMRDGRQVDSLRIEIGPTVAGLLKEGSSIGIDKIPPAQMMIAKETSEFKVKVFFWQMQVQGVGEDAKLNSFDADVFYAISPKH
jgi:hypothetical protein